MQSFSEGASPRSALIRRGMTIVIGLALTAVWTTVTYWLTGGPDVWSKDLGTKTHLVLNIAGVLAAATQAGLTKGLLDERLRRSSLFALSLFGLYALVIIMGRLYFSRPMLTSSLVEALAVSTLVVFLRKREAADRIAVIAPGLDPRNAISRAITVDDPAIDLRAFDTVLVSAEEMASPQWAAPLARAMLSGAKVRHIGEYIEDSRGAVSLSHFDLEDVSVNEIASYRSLKRALDVAMVAALLPFALIVGLGAAIGIKLSSRGPVFFLQERIGLAAKPFTMWKLRTMRVESSDPVLRATVTGDRRITPIGGFLRRFRIDELPQLWNILRGEMSLIGPRPEASALHAAYMQEIPHYTYRYLVRPGISGWAQVRCPPSATAYEARTKLIYDLYYVKHVSLLLDLKIIAKTIWTLLEGGGVR